MSVSIRQRLALRLGSLFVMLLLATSSIAQAGQPVVPGTGRRIAKVGDDFEDPEWKFVGNFPKCSNNLDRRDRLPAGEAKNGRWYEGMKRGQPDYIRRIATPAGGLPGSKGSLLLMSLQTGIPGRPSNQQQQDDFIADVADRLGGSIPVANNPSVVVRVFMPKVANWEKRSGCTFAFRAAVETNDSRKDSTYWPGMLIDFESKADSGRKYDSASFRIRAGRSGEDIQGPQIKQTGWWTLGMSFTPDGQIHYYAKPGIEDLTPADYIASHYPYGYRCSHFTTFFLNVCNGDDGKTWSTPWIVDDTMVYDIPRTAAKRR